MSLINRGDLQGKVLDAIAQGLTIKKACEIHKVSTASHYHWLNEPPYAEGYKFALQLRAQICEDEAERRAIDGYEETTTEYTIIVSDAGITEIPVSKVVKKKYSDALLARLLVASNPEKYGDKGKLEITSDTTVAEILAAARKRIAPSQSDKQESD